MQLAAPPHDAVDHVLGHFDLVHEGLPLAHHSRGGPACAKAAGGAAGIRDQVVLPGFAQRIFNNSDSHKIPDETGTGLPEVMVRREGSGAETDRWAR
jgi:hypothetical protein